MILAKTLDPLYSIFENTSDHPKPNIMFTINFEAPVATPEEDMYPYCHSEKQTFMLANLNPDKLKYIFQTFPFRVNDKMYYFDKFVTIRENARGIELCYLYNITRQRKSLLFKMVDSVINTYLLRLVGIRIRYKVHPQLQEKFGKIRTEEIMFKEPANLWNFSPNKEKFEAFMSNKLLETTLWIMYKEYFYSDDEFIETIMDTRLVTSLILG